MEIGEFLLARIAEDEAAAQAAMHPSTRALWLDAPAGDSPAWSHVARWNGLRVLAECEAKRRIVAWKNYEGDDPRFLREYMLGALALPYADHADYDPEWKP